jgi:hypothetical protein
MILMLALILASKRGNAGRGPDDAVKKGIEKGIAESGSGDEVEQVCDECLG